MTLLKRVVFAIFVSALFSSCSFSQLNWGYVDNSNVITSTLDMDVDADGNLWAVSWDNFPDNIYKITDDSAVDVVRSPWANKPRNDAPDQVCIGDIVWVTTFEGNIFRYDSTNTWSGPFDIDHDENSRYWCFGIPNGNTLVWNHNWIKIFSSEGDTPQTIYLEGKEDIVQAKIDSNGNLWALTRTGEFYKHREMTWSYHSRITLSDKEYVYEFWIIGNSIWIATNQRLFRIEDGKSKEILKFDGDSFVEEIVQDDSKRLWVFKSDSILRVGQFGKMIEEFSYPAKLDYHIAYNGNTGLIYVATIDGVYFLDINASK